MDAVAELGGPRGLALLDLPSHEEVHHRVRLLLPRAGLRCAQDDDPSGRVSSVQQRDDLADDPGLVRSLLQRFRVTFTSVLQHPCPGLRFAFVAHVLY